MSSVQPSPSRLPTPSFLRRPVSPSSSRVHPSNGQSRQESPSPAPKVATGSGINRQGSIADRAKLFERAEALNDPTTPSRKSFGYYGGVRVDSPVRRDAGSRGEGTVRSAGAASPREEAEGKASAIPSPTTSMPPPRIRPTARVDATGDTRRPAGTSKPTGLTRATSVRQAGDATSRVPSTTTRHAASRSVSHAVPKTTTTTNTSTRVTGTRAPSTSSSLSSTVTATSRRNTIKNGETLRAPPPRKPTIAIAPKPNVAIPTTKPSTGRPRPISMYGVSSLSLIKPVEGQRQPPRPASVTSSRKEDVDTIAKTKDTSTDACDVTKEDSARSRSPEKLPSTKMRSISPLNAPVPRSRSQSPAKPVPPNTRTQSPTKTLRPTPSNLARAHRRAESAVTTTVPELSTKPSFNAFKVDYPQSVPNPKPPTTAILQSVQAPKNTQTPQELLHMQTRLLQLSIIHEESFAALASLKKSAETQLKARYDRARQARGELDKMDRYEQRAVDLKGLEAILLPVSSRQNIPRGLDTSNPEEAIQAFSETVSKLMSIFAESPAPGEYTRLIAQFEKWIATQPELHVDGRGVEFSRDVTRVRRKLETGLRGLEGWEILLQDDESVQRSSLALTVKVLTNMSRTGLEELAAIQLLEKQTVADARMDLRARLNSVENIDVIGGWEKAAWM